jgi:transposase InsO family protein
MMCRVLMIKRSSYYAWRHRKDGKKTSYRDTLEKSIKEEYSLSESRYGSPRITTELNSKGIKVSRKTVAKYMKRMGIKSKYSKKHRTTTNSNHNYPVAENILNREFNVAGPGKAYVSDITYIPTTEGFLYLTSVLDLFDRNAIGWSMSNGLSCQETVIPALNMALKRRKKCKDLIFHSDRGIQYACKAAVNTLESYNITQSMSRKGNCWDNAVAESFFKTLKTELIYGSKRLNKEQTRIAIFEYIELWYNKKRRHSALNNLTIDEFWDNFYKTKTNLLNVA